MGELQKETFGPVPRYIVAGAWNTLFAYCLFVLLETIPSNPFNTYVNYSIATAIGLVQGFGVQKVFVWKSHHNTANEFVKFILSYASAYVTNIILLFISVEIFGLDPVVTQGVITGSTVVIMYFVNSKWVFKKNSGKS